MGNTCGGDKTSPCIDYPQKTTMHKQQCSTNPSFLKSQDFIENVEFAMLLYFFREIIQRNPVHSDIF
jgi:hypothetical protein